MRLLAPIFAVIALLATPLMAAPNFSFDSIDGGQIALDDLRGHPVLVVNTASRCGFTSQYDGLQALYDANKDKGLVVLAVPSGDFRQELASNEQVAEFCAVNFDLTLPMTTITHVKGSDAHPFYKWLKDTQGFEPAWNFNKVLLDPQGTPVATWGSATKPQSRPITQAIAPFLK